MATRIQQLIHFLDKDIWRIHTRKLPRQQSFFIKQLRVVLLAIREFRGNKCQLNASALTFYTLLSIVPVVAMAFGIAKGFGFDHILEKQLLEKFPGQEQTLTQVIGFANNLLANTQGGLIAGVGVIVLFWTVIKVLNSIEAAFNDIWGIKIGRSFGRKVSDYLSIMLICPFFLIASGGVTVFVNTQVEVIMAKFAFLGTLAPVIFFVLSFFPYILIWVLFAFIYIFMPNTKVKFSSGILAGIVAGTIYQVVQIIYIKFQVGVGQANVIYGSFAALPLFLLWLQISWRIVLFGTEIAFAHQNVDTYEFEHDCLSVRPALKRLLSLQIATTVIKRFAAGLKPRSATEIAIHLDLPIRLVQDILFELTEAGILTGARDDSGKQLLFQPARDIHHMTIHSVAQSLDTLGAGEIPLTETPELARLEGVLKGFDERIKLSKENVLLKDI